MGVGGGFWRRRQERQGHWQNRRQARARAGAGGAAPCPACTGMAVPDMMGCGGRGGERLAPEGGVWTEWVTDGDRNVTGVTRCVCKECVLMRQNSNLSEAVVLARQADRCSSSVGDGVTAASDAGMLVVVVVVVREVVCRPHAMQLRSCQRAHTSCPPTNRTALWWGRWSRQLQPEL